MIKISTLIVDDDAAARKTFGNILKAKGYGVDEAASGKEAISKARANFFNIVFIDIRLPDMSGLEVLKAMNEANEDTVAIMVTAYASMDSSIEAINKGAYSYIMKPIDMDQIMLVIDKALEKQHLSMENKRLLRELKELNEKLKEMDNRKSAFVANVSHEFKSPLSVIKESMALVIDGVLGEIGPKQKEILESGKKHIERLIRLVMDLLDLSKIEAGKMEIRRERVGIAALTREVLKTYEKEVFNKKLTLKEEIPHDIGIIWGDRDRLTEVIVNILNNAIKYTKTGGITVKLTGTDDDVRFEIADTGLGIAEENLVKIFDKFERVTAEKQEGTGLGLPIAKDIVELHRGKIWVESELGKGSKFIFVLPRDLRKNRV